MASKKNGNDKVGAVMVVGGGIGGMQASLDLANSGYKVYMVEETTAIGGRMAQLDKTFPTNDCSMCTISPKLIEVGKHLNIEILTGTTVDGLSGDPGNFKATVTTAARYIDMDKCNSCGDCIQVCPIDVPSEFDESTMGRKAVYKRYPQAIPGAVAISKANRAPCVLTCPTGTNVQGYVALVAEGRFEEAMDVIRDRNPFPSICGRVCHHPCEGECNRQYIDEAVAINPLKRFVSDWVFEQRAEGKADCAAPAKGELDPKKKSKKIAVIGGGPAGLVAARDLALRGYPVTLFEKSDKLGGTMRYGIPDYRLPQDKLQRDIDDIVASGFEVKTEVGLGADFTFESLKKDGYKAAFLAIGCTNPADLVKNADGEDMKGVDLDGVRLGVDFLRDVASGNGPKLDGKVVVIGGGNVAIDVAMTAKRQGASEVEVVSLECRDEMPAHEWEIQDAIDEGIKMNPSWGPLEILGENGKVKAVKLERCTCVFDDSGRFNPAFDDSCKDETPANHVIIAIGQRSDFSFLTDDDPLWHESKRFIGGDQLTLQTSVDWIFAGGDMFTGPKSVVEAINQGHEGAESIDRFLEGKDIKEGRAKEKPEPAPVPERHFDKDPRRHPAKTPVEERCGFCEIEQTFDQYTAVEEAKRCLACGICCECMSCVKACGAGAINHDDQPKTYDLDVGAVIFAPGYDAFNPKLRGEYGYGIYKNVVTSLEFERILSASGPYQGHVKRPSDLKEPKRMAWIQCVGSRDQSLGNDYCSSVCCMYAIKEALMAVDHVPGLESTVFYNDIRAYGKGFEFYYENSKEQYGVKYKRGIISTIKEIPGSQDLKIKYIDDQGNEHWEVFDMIVLSVGLCASASAKKTAAALGLESNRFGFLQGPERLMPGLTNREGLFVAGAFMAPMDIPETVMTASAAASMAGEYLAAARGTLVKTKTYPEEKDITKEEARIGVFVCRCGTNIARTVGVPDVVEYAKSLPGVSHAEENLYTCSSDTQQKITDTIVKHNLNRVVVASCTPRTHEPLFQDTLRDAGLNKYLFEMANIRDQCSWVHADGEWATYKAEDLVRMAVARAATLEPLEERAFDVVQKALVIGGGVTGMVSALSLADMGYECFLLEKERELGGNTRHLMYNFEADPQGFMKRTIEKVSKHPKITLFTGAKLAEFGGHVGNFNAIIDKGEEKEQINFGTVIVAIGGQEYKPTEYCYPDSDKIVTQKEFESLITANPDMAKDLKQVAMIQCVGSREENHMYCSRVCCQNAVKNALKIKELNPAAQVYVLYRDMRTYGFEELHYQEARDKGVIFLRWDPENRPEVEVNGGVKVTVFDEILQRPVQLNPDMLLLSAGIRPAKDMDLISRAMKVPLNADGYFLEAHMKLRPLDFPTEGLYLAGLAHAPKTLSECISQAKGAAARAATTISKEKMYIPGTVSVVDQARCASCLTCVRLCPYGVPEVGEDGVAYIEPAACQGCGVCASVCPRKAIALQHYKDGQVISKVEVLFGQEDFESKAPKGEASTTPKGAEH